MCVLCVPTMFSLLRYDVAFLRIQQTPRVKHIIHPGLFTVRGDEGKGCVVCTSGSPPLVSLFGIWSLPSLNLTQKQCMGWERWASEANSL